MEAVFLSRLQDIITHMERLTAQCVGFLTEDLVDQDRGNAEVACKKLETLHTRFSTELTNYFRLVTEPSADDISKFSTIQLQSEEILTELTLKLQNTVTRPERQGDGVRTSKLPKLSLPEFSGDILRWQQFWDHFHSNIDCRDLPDVDKLLYLKSSLKGDALRTIEGLETTNKNYSIAITTLRERYGKESQIIDAHYAALYKIKTADYTPADCRRTLNEVERHVRVLNSLGENTNHNHLRFIITEKFPREIIYEMKRALKTDTTEEIRKQLEIIVSAKEDASRITLENTKEVPHYTVEALHESSTSSLRYRPRPKERENKYGSNNNKFPTKRKNEGQYYSKSVEPDRKKNKMTCIFCGNSHFNGECRIVKTIAERKAKLHDRCFVCFKRGHQSKTCKKRKRCFHCGTHGKHNQALCPKKFPINPTDTKYVKTNTMLTSEVPVTILQTAVVHVRKEKDTFEYVKCRLLMDSGSQRTYVTQRIATLLNLPVQEEHRLAVFTFGAERPQEYDSPLVKFHMTTRTNKERVLYANVVPTITQDVPYPKETISHCENIALADDGSLDGRVDILIGNDYYFSFMSTEKKQIKENLFLVNSQLGWILTGKTDHKPTDDLSVVTFCQCHGTGYPYLTEPDLPLRNTDMKSLWTLEGIGITDSPKTTTEEEAVDHFNRTVKYENGRYQVKWPWTRYPPDLPTNYGLSFGRLKGLLKRISKDTIEEYNTILKEQLEAGVIEEVEKPENPYVQTTPPMHYLPHHIVKQEGKKGRLVYDASAKIKDQRSLNECLYKGPSLLEDLTALILTFRIYKIGITADVERAFLQVGLQEEDREVTRFLWIKDSNKEVTETNISHFRFTRVPFGIISSPFLLTATIRYHLSQKNSALLKEIADKCYVDNLITGVQTEREAMELYNHINKTFEELSMNIREWTSNNERFMKQVPDHKAMRGKAETKVLGLNWNLKNDTLKLKYKENTIVKENTPTKRDVLSSLARVYDPCGFVSPLVLSAKLIFQELCKRKLKWDDKIPEDLALAWSEALGQLNLITSIELQRFVGIEKTNTDLELHCFTDASTKAYAAVVYIVTKNGRAFLIGKSRVAPIKDQDNLKIPRLELLGVLIGSRLLKYTVRTLQININKLFLWTDSQIVIDWHNSNKLLPPFVARRVEEIKQNKHLTLRYVPTELNPADVATRPNKTKSDVEYWLKGPDFISQTSKTWPSQPNHLLLAREGLSETEEIEVANTEEVREPQDYKKTEETDKTKSKDPEEEQSILLKIKQLQAESYPEEVKGKVTNLSKNLKLFKDEKGILRCKGRLENTDWSYDTKYPILIPKNCKFTNDLIIKTHKDNYHVGANHTLSIIRKLYWIPQGKAQVMKIIRHCSSCVKHGGGPYKLPPTPALPPERVNYSSPFTFTGIDYLGHIFVKNTNGTEKRWICLFTCLAVRAVHLEIVKDLSAEEGLLALRRFISTRGVPTMITSDNATQFKLISEILTNTYCIENNIKWRFIPQLAPWFGGYYERLVALVKHCLKRTLQKHLLNDSQINTIIKEIEAILNTRPLTCVDSEMIHILKPADFLTMGNCITTDMTYKETSLEGTTTKVDLVRGWKRGQKILEEFKEIFLNRYLPSLRERYNNSTKESRITSHLEPKVGQIVQIKGNTKNREDWKVGKIVSLVEGKDKLCRIAKVRADNKEYTRSISQLYPLEIEENDSLPLDSAENVAGQTSQCSPVGFGSEFPIEETKIIEQNKTDITKKSKETETSQSGLEPDEETEISQNTDGVTLENDDVRNQLIEQRGNKDSVESQERKDQQEVECECKTNERPRPMRVAATRAIEKIREWTRNLVNLL